MHTNTPPATMPAYRFSVAPMMDWTHRHERYFLRLISKHCLLYTEMVTTQALLHGPRQRLLAFDPVERPVALQLGGSNPAQLAQCAQMAQDYGYDEVNLNVGCPSPRVKSGNFGACLMAEPKLVADCVAAMKAVVDIPVTVKTRIGVDEQDSYDFLAHFIRLSQQTGCERFIIHARKAWLQGLSPKQNREIPPLSYPRVYDIKKAFSPLAIIINGGLNDLATAQAQLHHVDGVMLGRAAYQNPYLLSQVDALFFGDNTPRKSRLAIVDDYFPYVAKQLALGQTLGQLTRHILGLFQGQQGAKAFRRYLSENVHQKGADLRVLEKALCFVDG